MRRTPRWINRLVLLALVALLPLSVTATDLGWDDVGGGGAATDPSGREPAAATGPGADGAVASGAIVAADGARLQVRLSFEVLGRQSDSPGIPVLLPGQQLRIQARVLGRGAPDHLLAGFQGSSSAFLRLGRAGTEAGGVVVYEATVATDALARGAEARGYAVFRTSPSNDTLAFRQALRGNRSRSLPEHEVGFYESQWTGESPSDTPEGATGFRMVAGDELVEARGTHPRALLVVTPSGQPVASGLLLLPGRARWVYFSGHYPYTMGARFNGTWIHPDTVEGRGWQDLDVMVVAGCYAVDVNARGSKPIAHGRGTQGARWWDKFQGALLGYHGMAPSQGVDAAIARRFVERMSASGVDRSDRRALTRAAAEAWMAANTVDHASSDASAIDADGRYYYMRTEEVNLRGIPFRPGVRWAWAEEREWRPQNRELAQREERDETLFETGRQVLASRFGGRPPAAEELLAAPEVAQRMQALGMDGTDAGLRQRVEQFLAYQAHIFYDVPSTETWQTGASFVARRALAQGRVPSSQELRAHFRRGGGQASGAEPPAGALEALRFQAVVWELARTPRTLQDGRRAHLDAATIERALQPYFRIDARARSIIQGFCSWVRQHGQPVS